MLQYVLEHVFYNLRVSDHQNTTLTDLNDLNVANSSMLTACNRHLKDLLDF